MPPDMTAGFPAGAARIRAARERLAAQALADALGRDPTIGERYDEDGLRNLLRDLAGYLDRLASAVASNDPSWVREWADWVAPVYRRRRVPMDDLVVLTEGVRRAAATVLAPPERVPADAACDAAVRVFRRYRRLAGDARKRNRLLMFLYNGA